jgi:VWFA-related protein
VIWRRVVAGFGICELVLALVLVAVPQNSSPQSTFTSNSELVLVPVQVMDQGGQPQRGLKKDAFVLESDGQPQQIAVFDEVRRSTQVMIPSPKAESTAPAPTTFSNLPADGIPHELVILVIDRVNTIPYLQRWVRDQLIEYLRAHPPQEPTALVAIAPGGLLQFHQPTWDGEALIQALQRMHVRGDTFSPVLTPDLRTSFHGRPGEYALLMANLEQNREAMLGQSLSAIHNTLRSFEEIAKAYAAVPGRKTVLWFTTGFPALDLEPNQPPLFPARLRRRDLRDFCLAIRGCLTRRQ